MSSSPRIVPMPDCKRDRTCDPAKEQTNQNHTHAKDASKAPKPTASRNFGVRTVPLFGLHMHPPASSEQAPAVLIVWLTVASSKTQLHGGSLQCSLRIDAPFRKIAAADQVVSSRWHSRKPVGNRKSSAQVCRECVCICTLVANCHTDEERSARRKESSQQVGVH